MLEALKLHALNPKTLFKQTMSKARKEYFLESSKLTETETQNSTNQKLQANQEKTQKLTQIKEYKLKKLDYEKQFLPKTTKPTKNGFKAKKIQLEKQSKERIDHLTFLFHSSANFVTHDNLSQKIDYCITNPVNYVSIDQKLEEHATREARIYEQPVVSKRELVLKKILFDGTV